MGVSHIDENTHNTPKENKKFTILLANEAVGQNHLHHKCAK
jgi:hypothetical protein